MTVSDAPAVGGWVIHRDRHRLNRGGDHAANHAPHTIALSRMRRDPRTRAYVERRTKDGLAKKDIIRCLKRYITREIHHTLTQSTHHQPPTTTTNNLTQAT